MIYKYGHFNEDGNEFIVETPETPRAFDNFLWNDVFFANVQQTGVGYCDYQIGELEAIQLLSGVGRICDFDVFGRDHLMSRLIYVRDNDTGEFWNVNWEPVRKAYESYQCIHGLGYSIIRTSVNQILAELRILVPIGKDPVELWSLKIQNSGTCKRNISVFVYNQVQLKYKWGFDSYGDAIYRCSCLKPELNAILVTKHPNRKPHEYLTAFLAADLPITAYDGSRDAFVGPYSTLQEPKAVVNGRCSNTPGSFEATVTAAQFNLELDAGREQEITLMLGAADTEERIAHLREKYLGNFETCLKELKDEKKRMTARNRVSTPDQHFDRIMNHWVKQASLFGATWCRWGWNGYRDIVQHGLGVSVLQPARTKAILLEALRYQCKNGLALRGWHPVDEKPYSDSALWLAFTLTAYLKETGDLDLLRVMVPYYDGGEATVLEHVEAALGFLEANKGRNGLCLIKYGDWNDSLTAVGKEGRGESVWLSQAYAEALRELAGLAEYMRDGKKKEEYLRRREGIIQAINRTAWDGNWYIRCFDDDGAPVGSHVNEEGRIFMETQCWALIAGVADEDRSEALLQACDGMLLTELGYLLLTPTFTKTEDRIGRISSMEPGTAENGTVYSHLNIWMILGLLRYGLAEKAYDLFKRITPGYVKDADDRKQRCPPYIYANGYFGPDHRNNAFQMEFTWITGSVAWFNAVILQDMLGAKAEYGGLAIQPRLPAAWERCEVERYFRGATYHITIHNPEHLRQGIWEIRVDGNAYTDRLLPVFADGKTHQVEAVCKRA